MSSFAVARSVVAGWAGIKRSPDSDPRSDNRSWSYIAILAMVVPATLLLVAGAIAGLPPKEGEIEGGISVGEFQVDGDWETFSAELDADLDAYLSEPVTLQIGDQQVQTKPEDLGMSVDLDATYQDVLDVGRGSFVVGARERFNARVTGVEVMPVVHFDYQELQSELATLGSDVLKAPRNARFEAGPAGIVVLPSAEGVGIDTSEVVANLRNALAERNTGVIDIPIVTIEPSVTTHEAEEALVGANELASRGFTLTDSSGAWSLRPEELASSLTITDGELVFDDQVLATYIGSLSETIAQAADNAEIVNNGDGTFSIKAAVPDRRLDVETSAENVAAALMENKEAADLVVVEQDPPITGAKLKGIYTQITDIVTKGVTLTWPEGEWSVDRVALANSLIWDPQSGAVGFNQGALTEAIRPGVDLADHPPTNIRWFGHLVTSENSQPGLAVDLNATVAQINDAVLIGESTVPMSVQQGGPIDEAAMGIHIDTVLGYAQSYYGDSSHNRKINVETAAASLDGAMIAPNSTFSFNDAIGGTAGLDDGYMMGYGIIRNENGEVVTVPSVAGGICQVSTMAFQAAFWAGMPITTRSWHMYWIDNYGIGPGGLKGLDATVDPGSGLDFTFYNPTNEWLAIRASANGENVTVELWGPNMGWNVQVDGPNITDVVTADQTDYEQYDPTLEPGQRIRVEVARDGFTASIHRTVTDGNGQQIDDHNFVSTYVPSRNMTLIGPE